MAGDVNRHITRLRYKTKSNGSYYLTEAYRVVIFNNSPIHSQHIHVIGGLLSYTI